MADKNISRVTLNGAPLIDIHEDSVTPETLKMNETAHDRSGTAIVGNYEGGDVSDCYKITDPASTGLADDDYIPFNDVSDAETPKKKTLFSTIVDKLKDTFATITQLNTKQDTLTFDNKPTQSSNNPVKSGGIYDVSPLQLGNAIPENADLNTYTTEGAYFIQLSATAQTISNIPVPWAGKLIVMKVRGSNNLIQRYYTYDLNIWYQRSTDNSGSTWTDWAYMSSHTGYGSSIPSDSDLNNYKNPGVYNIPSNAVAATISNMPIQKAGKLIVMNIAGNKYREQQFIPISVNDGVLYQRFWSNDNSADTWSAWKKIATIDNVIESNKGLSSSAISSLDDIPVNTAGRIKLAAAISPLGAEADYVYMCYGTSVSKTVELSRMVKANSDLFWKNTTNISDGWTGWQPLSRTGTYIGTCNTAADQQHKIATVDSDFRLVKGVRIGIKFSYTNTYSSTTSAPVTLNVNSTGDKNIYYYQNNGTTGNTGINSTAYGAERRYTYFVYDGTQWVWDSCGVDYNTTYNVLTKDQLVAGTDTASRVVRADYLKSGIRQIFGYLYGLEISIPDNGGKKCYLLFADVTTWYNSTTTGQTTICFEGFLMLTRANGNMRNITVQLGLGVSYQKVTSIDNANLILKSTNAQYAPCILYNSSTSKYYLALYCQTVGNIASFVGRWINIDPTSFSQDSFVVCTDTSGTLPSNWSRAITWGTKFHKFTMLQQNDIRSLGFGLAYCSTAAATVAKSATLDQYTLKTGGYVTVRFDYDVPANATININGEGSKPIYDRGAAIQAGIIKAGNRVTFVYNGSQYELVSNDRWNKVNGCWIPYLINQNVTVSHDGTKTNATLLGELYTLLKSKWTNLANGEVLEITGMYSPNCGEINANRFGYYLGRNNGDNTIIFSGDYNNSNGYIVTGSIILRSSDCKIYMLGKSSSADTFNDYTNSVWSSPNVFVVRYNVLRQV